MKLLTKKQWLKQFDNLIKDAEKRGIKFSNKNKKKLESRYYAYCYNKERINGLFYGIYHDKVESLLGSSESRLLNAIKNFPKDRY